MKPKSMLAVALLLLAVVFMLQNAAPASVRLLGWEFSASLAVVLLLVYAAGLVSGLLFALVARRPERPPAQ